MTRSFTRSFLGNFSSRSRVALWVFAIFCGFAAPIFGDSELQPSDSPERLFDIPFFFAVPKSSWMTLPPPAAGGYLSSGEPMLSLPVKGLETSQIGLRLVVMHNTVESHSSAAKKLFDAGLLQDGDVVLVFHANWAHTMAYPHLQMGISHTGLIFTDGGRAYNVDMPLDSFYNGERISSQLDSEDYQESETLHVVRPRNFTAADRSNLQQWVKLLRDGYPEIRMNNLLPFNSDYLSPGYHAQGVTPAESVLRLGALLSRPDASVGKMPMYCSEFAWHLLSLSSLDPARFMAASPDATSVRQIFPPKYFVRAGAIRGLAEGPLMLLELLASEVTDEEKLRLVDELFATGDPAHLSSGHKAVAESVQPLMNALQPYCRDTVLGAGNAAVENQTAAEAVSLNAQMFPNYSPTSFLLNTFPQPGNSEPLFDYLYTITFLNPEGYQKALDIAAAQSASKP